VAGVRAVKQVEGHDFGHSHTVAALRGPLVAAGVAWLA
jgi:hypothetical protein